MTWRLLGLLVLVGVLAGCGKHYWESPGRGVQEFSLDSRDCIKDATGKYGVASEGMRAIKSRDPSCSGPTAARRAGVACQ